jgi:type I site-specific restriction-modification system R (restriction) subunit
VNLIKAKSAASKQTQKSFEENLWDTAKDSLSTNIKGEGEILVDIWLTGFDVPFLDTLLLMNFKKYQKT